MLGGLAAASALPAAAHAGPRADYKQMFTTPVPGASSGTDTQILYKHPDDPNRKPIPIRQEVFTFPEGTEFDNAAAPVCTASEMQLQLMGDAACPPETRVGGGEGTFMSGPDTSEGVLQVDGWNAPDGTLLLGGSREPPIRFATRARREGRVVTVQVPRTPGGPPDGEGAIRRVHNVFEPRGSGDRVLVRTPRVCPPSGVWRFHGRFTFADGAVEEDTYDMPCLRDGDAPRIALRGVPRLRCAARDFRVRVRVTDASPLARVRLLLDGRRLRRTTESSFTRAISVRRLRPGRHRLTVTASDTAGNLARRTVRFRRCAR